MNLYQIKKKITAYKPEDLLMSVEAIKNRLFEKIYYKFENSKKKNFPLFFHFSDSAWAFKKLNYKINFGKYCYYIKFYELNEIYKILIKNGLPKLFAKIISNILNIILKLFFIKKMKKKNRKLKFVNYLKPPNWSNFLIKDFVKYWKCITLHRSYDFLNWRVFNNPYTDNKFVAFYYKKKPIGYIIYNIKNSNLTVIDLIFIPSEKKISPELIMDEVLDYLDDLSLKKKIKICKFELYLNSKINLKISDNLSKKGYFKKNKYSDFSYKCIKNKINIKEINNAYITNINKTGR